MSDELKAIVSKLEWRVDGHDDELDLIKDESKELQATLYTITNTLKQIKWIAVGGAIVFFADQVGVMGMLKLAAL